MGAPWQDVRALAESHLSHASPDEGHFLGAIVLQTRQTGFSLLEATTIIDGRQRLTTLQILLHALCAALADHGLDDLARRVRRLTENDIDLAHPEDSFKVWPTNRDRDAYTAFMRAPGKTAPATPASVGTKHVAQNLL